MKRLTIVLAFVAAWAPLPEQPAPRVVLISVDGLWPGDLRRAESAGVRLPVLDSLRRVGAFAAGVIGSVPSVTYPSHTTIITGVPPARHGIYANRRSWMPTDTGRAALAWYWEADFVRVRTLFDAARQAGKRTAAVAWPVTADHPAVTYNVPEAWGAFRDSDLVVLRRRGTPWLLDSLGAPAAGTWNDSLRASWTAAIIRRWEPDLVLLHLLAVDAVKHDHGPMGDTVWATIAVVDRQLGWVLDTVRASPRPTTVIVTSDHGFFAIRQALRPGVLLARAGLVRFDSAGRVTDWDAGVQVNGGSAMLIPRDRSDPTIVRRLRGAIPDYLVGPGRPIRAVWPADTLRALGGDPRAVWAIDMNEGFYTLTGFTGDLLVARAGGGHGFDPRRPELHAFFLAAGPGIRPGSSLPLIRQTDIAPTVAKILGLRLPDVEGRAVF